MRAILRKSILGLTAATMLAGVGGQTMAAGPSPMMEPGDSSHASAGVMAVEPTAGHSIFTQGKNAAKSIYQAAIKHPYKTGALVIGAAAACGLYAYAKTNNYDTTQMMEGAQKSIETFWSDIRELGDRTAATVGWYDHEITSLSDSLVDKNIPPSLEDMYKAAQERLAHLQSLEPIGSLVTAGKTAQRVFSSMGSCLPSRSTLADHWKQLPPGFTVDMILKFYR